LKWLQENDLKWLVPVFKENELGGGVLLKLSEETLKNDLQIKAFGNRLKLLEKIENLTRQSEVGPTSRSNPAASSSPNLKTLQGV